MGGGFALTVTSALIAAPKVTEDYGNILVGVFSSEPVQENNYTAENILLITGTASMLASIPFFIASKKNKRRAMDITANIKMEDAKLIRNQFFVQTSYPAITVKIKL